MLERLLCMPSFEKILWGIDDPATIIEIERACGSVRHMGARPSKRASKRLILGIICAFVVVGLASYLASRYGAVGRGWEWCVIGVAIGVAYSHLTVWWAERPAMKALPEVLRSMGRCMNCGYKLDPETDKKCPECGRAGEDRSSSKNEPGGC